MPQSAVVTFLLDDPLTVEDDGVLFVFASVDPVPVAGVRAFGVSLFVDPFPDRVNFGEPPSGVDTVHSFESGVPGSLTSGSSYSSLLWSC